jgi:hypothetical protein
MVALAVLAAAGCSTSSPVISPGNTPYAVLYGHVTTTGAASAVLVAGQAYLDSSSALAGDSLFGGFSGVALDAQGNYLKRFTDPSVQRVYFNVQAVSTSPAGRDSVMAVRVQLDSAGGAPAHDSLRFDFSLP